MNEGDVILTPVPQADGVIKNRPAIFLREMPPFGDVLACGVSRQLHQEVKGFDEVIQLSDVDYAATGLRSASLIRLGISCGAAPKHNHRLNRRDLNRKAQAFT
jgi:mRNA interferase MazF